MSTVAEMRYDMYHHLLSEKSARRLLEMTNHITKDWMAENAIHTSHALIGMHQLRRNDFEGAAESLIESANTVGSPHLDSFGPTCVSFDLANGLLKAGQREAVLEFLRNVKAFWRMDHAQRQLNDWIDAILNGHTPELGRYR